jgi:hypothetical protein
MSPHSQATSSTPSSEDIAALSWLTAEILMRGNRG